MFTRSNQGGGLARRSQTGLGRPIGGNWLLRGDPFQELEQMRQQMDNLFSQAFGSSLPAFGNQGFWSQDTGAEPDVDIYETDNEFIVHAALPGVSPQDIQINATENSIMLTAEVRSPFQNQGQTSFDQQGGQWSGQSNQQGNAYSSQQGGQYSGQQGSQVGGQQGSQYSGQPTSQQSGQQTGQQITQQGGAASGTQIQQRPMTHHRQSRFSRQARFEFAFSLPEEIRPNDVRANFRNGLLELHLPKAESATRHRTVTIPVEGASSQTSQISSGTGQSGMSQGAGVTGEHQPRDQEGTSGAAGVQSESAQSQPVGSQSKAGAKP